MLLSLFLHGDVAFVFPGHPFDSRRTLAARGRLYWTVRVCWWLDHSVACASSCIFFAFLFLAPAVGRGLRVLRPRSSFRTSFPRLPLSSTTRSSTCLWPYFSRRLGAGTSRIRRDGTNRIREHGTASSYESWAMKPTRTSTAATGVQMQDTCRP